MAGIIKTTIQNALSYAILITSVGLIAYRYPKAKRFVLKDLLMMLGQFIFMMLSSLGIYYVRDIVSSSDYVLLVWLESVKYFLLYISCIFVVKACFECTWWEAIFSGTTGYCIEHFGSRISAILEVYTSWHWALYSLANVIFSFSVIFVLYLTVIRKLMTRNKIVKFKGYWQICMAVLVISINIFYSAWVIYTISIQTAELHYLEMETALMRRALAFAYLDYAVIAALAFFLQFSIYAWDYTSAERDILTRLLDESQHQYLQEKQNIDLINLKSHDLRHQIAAIGSRIDSEELKEILDAVDGYDSVMTTGNKAIDIVLTQKSLYCIEHEIKLTCMIDGKNYDFIADHELFSLFGNFIDNAVEGVLLLPPEKRVISITENLAGNLVNLRIENYFDGHVIFRENLPVTQRGEDFHGFGMKSMKLIAQRYGGDIRASVHDDIFILDIFLIRP